MVSSWTNYDQNVTLSGNDVIEVVFTNDCSGGGYDRNLYVDYVVVDGVTIQAEGGAALIDKGSGSAAFDWQNMVVGQQNLAWNAALRLVKGSNAIFGSYDANGCLVYRIAEGKRWSLPQGTLLSYDVENRLTSVQSSLRTDSFVYDGDGARVKSVVNSVTTAFVGTIGSIERNKGFFHIYFYPNPHIFINWPK